MTEAQAKNVMEILDLHAIDYYLYEGYSGREMYGRTTKGVVCNLRPAEFKDLMEEAFTEILIEEGVIETEEEIENMDGDEWNDTMYYHELFPPLKSDSMGLKIIHY